MDLMEGFENFIISRRLKGLSNRTLQDYSEFVKPFIRYAGERVQISEITQKCIDEYLLTLWDRRLAKATIATYTRHIKVFLSWLSEETEVKYRTDKIILPKTPKKQVHLYTPNEIIQIFAAVENDVKWIELRNKACIALMLDSGLRRNEVCTAMKANYNAAEHTLIVCGKGEKTRIVPVGKASEHFISAYLEACPFKESGVIFVDKLGKQMTGNALKLLISKVSRKLPFEFSCHKLRHNFATNYCIDMYEAKGHMDSYSLQILMGHSSIETTMGYIHHATGIVAARANISHLDLVLKE